MKAEEMLKPFKDTLDWDSALALVSTYDKARAEKLGIYLHFVCHCLLLHLLIAELISLFTHSFIYAFT